MTEPVGRVQARLPAPQTAPGGPQPTRAESVAARLTSDRYVKSQAPGATRNAIKVLIDGDAAFPEMFRLVNSARKSIQLEFFIMHDDRTTWDMAKLLAEKARQGVDVKLLYDPNGSSDFTAKLTATMSRGPEAKVLFSDADVNRVIGYLKNHNVQVLPSVKKSILFSDVDHRKFLLVDGQVGMTGGMNIGDEYRHEWHDLMVRVEGPAVAAMQKKFFEGWRAAGGRAKDQDYMAPQLGAPDSGGIPTWACSVARDDKSLKKVLLQGIDQANDSILMETAYLGDPQLHDRLKAAVGRGVKVTVVLPNFSDVAPLNYPNRAFLDELRAAGIRIYLLNGGDKRFLHVKATVIDGWWVMLGSANGDYKALEKNREFNLVFADGNLARDLERDLFAKDIGNSTPVTGTQSPWYLDPFSAIARWAYKLY